MIKSRPSERTMADAMAKYTGQPLAVLCARYWYRGMVDEVGKDYITLSYVRAVEVTGPAASQTTQTEDQVPSDLTISLGAVEQFCQPFWCWANMPIKPSEEIQKAIIIAAEERARREAEREAERVRQQQEQEKARQAAKATAAAESDEEPDISEAKEAQ